MATTGSGQIISTESCSQEGGLHRDTRRADYRHPRQSSRLSNSLCLEYSGRAPLLYLAALETREANWCQLTTRLV